MIHNHQVQKLKNVVLTQDDRALIVFTDEKDFTLETVKNCRNDRVYGPSKNTGIAPNRLCHDSSTFSINIWFLGRKKQTSTLLTHTQSLS